jgi:hypothetical protein
MVGAITEPALDKVNTRAKTLCGSMTVLKSDFVKRNKVLKKYGTVRIISSSH